MNKQTNCSYCHRPLSKTVVLSPTLNKKRQEQCLGCGGEWVKELEWKKRLRDYFKANVPSPVGEHWVEGMIKIVDGLLAQTSVEVKCPDCDPKDEHIDPQDRSTTRISRPCAGCGKHQTIAGALLKSPQWKLWTKEVSRRMSTGIYDEVYDTDETEMTDAMSDEHFLSFMKFTAAEARAEYRKKVVEMMKKFENEMSLEQIHNGYSAIKGIKNKLETLGKE